MEPVAIVAIVGAKGGTGKSTLARALLVEATRAGCRARLVDMDPQASAYDWARLRRSQDIEPAVDVVAASTVTDALRGADDLDYLVVDGPGRASATTRELAESSDLVVLPSGCSSDDLRPAVRLANELVTSKVPRGQVIAILSRVGTAGEERDARVFLEQAGVPVITGSLPERPAYRG